MIAPGSLVARFSYLNNHVHDVEYPQAVRGLSYQGLRPYKVEFLGREPLSKDELKWAGYAKSAVRENIALGLTSSYVGKFLGKTFIEKETGREAVLQRINDPKKLNEYKYYFFVKDTTEQIFDTERSWELKNESK